VETGSMGGDGCPPLQPDNAGSRGSLKDFLLVDERHDGQVKLMHEHH